LLNGAGWTREPVWSLWGGTGKLPFLPQEGFLSLFVVQCVVSCEGINAVIIIIIIIIIIISPSQTPVRQVNSNRTHLKQVITHKTKWGMPPTY